MPRQDARREADAFPAAVRGQAQVPIPATHARDAMRCITARYASAAAAGAGPAGAAGRR